MSITSRSISAIGKLAVVALLLAAFLGGMAAVVVLSLSGSEIKVPEIVGKDFLESEKELAALGLKIRKRADRVSPEEMNTVLEQLPKAGETVKTGQWISVVVSKAGMPSEETPASLRKDLLEEDDSSKIEEMISDKPKKKSNSNTSKKKAETTRDVIANESSSNTSTDSKTDTEPKSDDSEKKDSSDKPKEPASDTKPKGQATPAGKPGKEPKSQP